MSFICTKCGLCCHFVDKFPQLVDFDRGDGICVHLKNNLCDIYNSRPEICNVDLMYEKYYYEKYTQDEYYQMIADACYKLQHNKVEM